MEHLTSSSSARTVEIRAGGPLTRLLVLIVMIFFGLLALVILVPLLLIAIVLGLLVLLYLKIRSFFVRAHDPNGPLDGRHNVKVIDRDE